MQSEIQTIQPHGPYILVGACFGATSPTRWLVSSSQRGKKWRSSGCWIQRAALRARRVGIRLLHRGFLKRALALGNFVKDG